MINRQFQELLGRAPSSDEMDYFNKFINEGSLQAEEIGQILQSLPEYQQRKLETDTSAYNDRLTANDDKFLSNATDRIGAQVNSRFAGMGRPVSSALAASTFGQAGQVAQGLQQNRQSLLADFYGRGLNRNAALGVDQGQGAKARGYGLRDESRHRAWDIEDYYRQQNDFNNYQNSKSGWNAITPEFAVNAAIGAAGKIGAAYAGGYAGSRGAKAGQSGGGLF